jgi:hypothetical protein
VLADRSGLLRQLTRSRGFFGGGAFDARPYLNGYPVLYALQGLYQDDGPRWGDRIQGDAGRSISPAQHGRDDGGNVPADAA